MLLQRTRTTIEPDAATDLSRFVRPLFWIALLALITFYLLRPIMDFDFWWHLKTGEVMLQQKALLSVDPFNFTGDVTVKRQESLFLNAYWLWQISAAGLFALFSFNGIILLKFITAALIAFTVFHQLQRQNLSGIGTFLLVTFGSVIFVSVYNLERPQVFSILFLTVLVGMIARLRAGGKPSRLLWPMMALWANIHGGYVVGDILLGLAALGFLIQYRRERRVLIRLVLWSSAGILASFLNPGGWNAIIEAAGFMDNSLTALNAEYRSTWAMYCDGSRMEAVSLWLISLLHLTGLLLVRRRYWPEIFISLFIIFFGLKYIRNTGFIAISLLPATCYYLEETIRSRIKIIPAYARFIIYTACLILVSWMVLKEWRIRKVSSGPVAYTFPVEMAAFLKGSGLSGNLFNDYGIGGYLDWALYPQWKTFIDGRNLDANVSRHYRAIALASQEVVEGRPLYELLLDRYDIEVIAMRTSFASGQMQPLLGALLHSPDWIPVYLDWMSFVLVRNSAGNAGLIRKYGIGRHLFIDSLSQTVASMLKASPGHPAFTVLYNDVLTLKKDFPRDAGKRR